MSGQHHEKQPKKHVPHHVVPKHESGYTDEVAEECHDLIDRAEEEAHLHEPNSMYSTESSGGMRSSESKSSGMASKAKKSAGLESKSSEGMGSKSSEGMGKNMKEGMGSMKESMKDTMGMKKE
ncbi:hypothetical protein QBC42DRAFT_271548 [Cladorrhinum samala]|uniref:Uncharacterized protein n=1 Tax=Cladorrhinum samala TaxID=585594 RepID=A0AAV9HLE6_9PEZI|nr:hypothetical protein QBC42DRAFT_271548 [Cladorrhinum samala]